MEQDDLPTVRDLSCRPLAPTAPSSADTRLATPPTGAPTLSAPLIDLPKPETVLRRAEIEQTRRTAISGLVFNTLGLAATPMFGGDRLAVALFMVALVIGELNNGWLLYMSWTERRYRQRHAIAYFLIAILPNAGILYYLGVFGPILVMFVLNVYTACMAYGRRVAQVTLVVSTGPMAVLGSLMALGWIDDPGLISGGELLGSAGRGLLVASFALFMLLTYAQARRTREVMVASLIERDAAVRQASHREALFIEARQDLERALMAGGLGRFSEQTLGSYKLGALLGRGGMGEVYEAVHVTSGEPAAVKMLLPEVIGRPEYVLRFLREVRIAASLDSPHVVRVLEIGDESMPLPYLAMERLRGEDLAQILRRSERLEARDVVDLVRQVGRGIAAAAAAGIVHRDLKPQNLFLNDSHPPIWKILDFGVSKLIDSDATLTRGETVGTPHYMAPEQARGSDVDVRADLYALGAIAYRALTGHQPFKGDESAAILVLVLEAMPVRPTALVKLHADVDLALAIALAKHPDDRFQSPDELADALESALSGALARILRARAVELLEAVPWSEVARAAP